MQWLYAAAREEGKYRAIGGHRVAVGRMGKDGEYHCAVCDRKLTGNGERHAPRGR